MDAIHHDELSDWLRTATEGAAPPAFALAPPSFVADFVLADVAVQLRELGGEIVVRHDWGPMEFRISRRGLNSLSGDALPRLTAVCQAADDRAYYRVAGEERGSSSLALEIESALDLPVIGPGGRMLLFAAPDGFYGELSVRRRFGDPTPSIGWRAADQLQTRLRSRFELESVALSAELGYFEASVSQQQRWLRPAFLFVLEQQQPEESGPGWRTVVVEPATDVEGLPPEAGLQQWWDE